MVHGDRRAAHDTRYPHVYNMTGDMMMTLRLRGDRDSAVEVIVDGVTAGSLRLGEDKPEFTEMTVSLRNQAGEHEIILRMTGRLAVDWFSLGEAI